MRVAWILVLLWCGLGVVGEAKAEAGELGSSLRAWGERNPSVLLAQGAPQGEPLRDDKFSLPMEWPLILVQGFSGAVVISVSSIILQSLFDVIVQGASASLSDEERVTASVISAATTLAIVPWLVALTVWGLGRLSNNYYGNYWWTLLGAYIGQGTGFLLGLLLTNIDKSPDLTQSRLARVLINGVLTGFGAVLFYVLTRKAYAGIQHLGGLMNFDGKRWHWGLPLPMVARDHRATQVQISLFRGQF